MIERGRVGLALLDDERCLLPGHLSDDEDFPRAEFASTTGTLLIRVWNHRGEQPKPRPATDADREQWASTFHRNLAGTRALAAWTVVTALSPLGGGR
jgi:hypothetical protein